MYWQLRHTTELPLAKVPDDDRELPARHPEYLEKKKKDEVGVNLGRSRAIGQ